jgi:hypothetical protein
MLGGCFGACPIYNVFKGFFSLPEKIILLSLFGQILYSEKANQKRHVIVEEGAFRKG